MKAAASPLARFVLCTLAWLAPCFAAWYLVAAAHAGVAGGMARILCDEFKLGIVSKLEQAGSQLTFVTTLEVMAPNGQPGLLAVEVNPLVYTYGVALFLALSLAARGRWRTLLIGPLVLLPFQAWGIAFDFLAQVGVKQGPQISALAGLMGGRAEFIALAYQAGNLIFPSVAPVLVWAFFNRALISGPLSQR